MAENVNEKLFSEFAPNTTQEWKDKVIADLKGADFDKKLVWRTNEGFNVQPMYRLEDMKDLKNLECFPGEYPFVRGNKKNNNEWLVRQDIVVEDVAEANKKALDVRAFQLQEFHESRHGHLAERYLLGMYRD